MRRTIILALGMTAILAGLFCAGDYAIWRYRLWSGRHPYGSYVVTIYYVIPEKNNKMEFLSGDRVPERCVNSVIPHQGYRPCWYLARHTERRIEE